MTYTPKPPGHVVDVNGDVWADTCSCPMHERGPGQRGHDAKPIGNIHRDPTLALRLGVTVAQPQEDPAA